MSIRATVRVTGVAKNTITKLLVDLGEACSAYMNETLVDLPCTTRSSATRSGRSATPRTGTCRRSARASPAIGDVWTWVALDADTKLVAS